MGRILQHYLTSCINQNSETSKRLVHDDQIPMQILRLLIRVARGERGEKRRKEIWRTIEGVEMEERRCVMVES